MRGVKPLPLVKRAKERPMQVDMTPRVWQRRGVLDTADLVED